MDNLEKALKLIDAGFTADEIREMISPKEKEVPHVLSPEQPAAATSPAAAAEAPEAKAEEVKKTPEPDPMDAIRQTISDQISSAMKGYEENMAKVMKLAGMPSLEDVKPKGVEDIISNFFKEA